MSKSEIAIELSKLQGFEEAKAREEQYVTDPEIAGEVLWFAKMNGDIEDKQIADLGAGTGYLGIGSLLLGAKFVWLVEKDQDAVKILKENLDKFEYEGQFEILGTEISNFTHKCDVVIQNPPFGTKEAHADKEFLEKAFEIAPIIYTFHKTSTKGFVEAISKDHNYKITHQLDFDFPIKATMDFHEKRIEKIKVSCFRLTQDQTER
ncbi:METTL5 family protein [Nanoarchaeota archaeon]